MITPNTATTFELLDQTAWQQIAEFLDLSDIARLQQVSKTLNVGINSERLDGVWQPFLNQLCSIDTTILVVPEAGKSIKDSFVAAFEQISSRQRAEIDYIAKHCNKGRYYNHIQFELMIR